MTPIVKRVLVIFTALLLLSGVLAYYLTREEQEAIGPPPDLTGRWIQVGASMDSDWFFYADISDGLIEVWWYLPSDDERALYWSGTFTAPQDGSLPYTWQSINDLAKARTCQRASREATKSFTYSREGKISYVLTAGHLQMGYALERAPADFPWGEAAALPDAPAAEPEAAASAARPDVPPEPPVPLP